MPVIGQADRFACPCNAKVQCFCINTRFYQPGSSGVNAFSQGWSHHNNWLCPPGLFDVQSCQAHEAVSALIRGLSSFQSGSRITSGHCFALMEFTGVTLFMTGLFRPISLIYLLHAKPKILFLVASLYYLFQLLCALTFPLE